MPRKPDPRREEARVLWEQSGGTLTLREIADKLELKENTVSCWKSRDAWGKKKDRSTANGDCSTAKRKKGGQPGNQNAASHGRPVEHGLVVAGEATKKIKGDPSQLNSVMAEMPEDIREIMARVEDEDPVDLQRQIVNFQFAAIVQSYRFIQLFTEAAEKMYIAANSLKSLNAEKMGIDENKAMNYEEKRVLAVLGCLNIAKQTLGPDKRAAYVMAVNKAIADFHRSVRMYYKEQKGHEDKIADAKIEKMNAEVAKLAATVGDKEIHIHHGIPSEQKEAADGDSD